MQHGWGQEQMAFTFTPVPLKATTIKDKKTMDNRYVDPKHS